MTIAGGEAQAGRADAAYLSKMEMLRDLGFLDDPAGAVAESAALANDALPEMQPIANMVEPAAGSNAGEMNGSQAASAAQAKPKAAKRTDEERWVVLLIF